MIKPTNDNFKMLLQYLDKSMQLSSRIVSMGTPGKLTNKQSAEVVRFVASKGFKVTSFASNNVYAEKV
jgi:ribulose bisphosphate carboxylase small subunit